jgi:hypothetical protein
LLTIITTLEAEQHDCGCTSAGSGICCGKESSMRRNNSHHLITAAQRRRADSLERARQALHELGETGQRHTIVQIAAHASVSRS